MCITKLILYKMSVIFVLIVVGILVASGFLVAFIWAVKSGQFEDSYTPSVRILFDDDPEENSDNIQTKESTGDKPAKT